MAIPGCRSFLKPILVCAGLAWMAGCIGTETTNPKGAMMGHLVDEAGNPRAGVTVNAIRADKIPPEAAMAKISAEGAIAVTNARGYYRFDSLPQGRYNLIGETDRGVLAVLIPKVDHRSGEPDRYLGIDTLRAPGRVSGRILVDGEGKEGVFCYLPGTGLLDVSDETGTYVIRGVPQGRYELGFSYPGLETLTDSGIVVDAGGTSALPERRMEADPTAVPPAPGPLRAEYDTLSGVVALSWSEPAASGIGGYVIYRIDSAATPPQPIKLGTTTDIRFLDTLFRNPTDTLPLTVAYQVRSLDGAGNLSREYSPAVSILCSPPSFSATLLSIAVEAPSGNPILAGDSVRLIARYYNRRHAHEWIEWSGQDFGIIRRLSSEEMPSQGADTLMQVWTEPRRYVVVFEAKDITGNVWSDTLRVDVGGDPSLKAYAGRDAVVRVGEPTRLTGRGEAVSGDIAQYAWDFDADRVFDDSSAVSGDFTHTFTSGARQTPVLRVRSSKGGTAYDTLDFKPGEPFSGLSISSDMVFRAADGPYSLVGRIVIEKGAEVTVMPGTDFNLWQGAGFFVRGVLKCAGTAMDSIRFTHYALGGDSITGGIHFSGGPASRFQDSTQVSGSLLRFVSFRKTLGVRIQRTLVTVEDCTFQDVIEGGFPAGTSQAAVHLDFQPGDSLGSDDGPDITGAWFCRRNRFLGSIAAIAGVFPDSVANQVSAYIQGNETDGSGILITSPRKSMKSVSIEGNVIRVPRGSAAVAAFTIGGSVNCLFRNNLVESSLAAGDSVEVTGLHVIEETQGEIAHNEFRGCGRILRDEGLSGRFHSNIADSGMLDLRGKDGFQADSNSFGPAVRFVGVRIGIPRDFRNNYWSTMDGSAVRGRMPGTEDGTLPLFAEVDPMLAVPPPKAGLLGP